MVYRYPSLVEAVIQFKRVSRIDIARHRSKSPRVSDLLDEPYAEQPDACEIVMAENYHRAYHPIDDFYYCLKGSQTSKSLTALFRLSSRGPNQRAGSYSGGLRTSVTIPRQPQGGQKSTFGCRRKQRVYRVRRA
jgi:hypothetical protein